MLLALIASFEYFYVSQNAVGSLVVSVLAFLKTSIISVYFMICISSTGPGVFSCSSVHDKWSYLAHCLITGFRSACSAQDYQCQEPSGAGCHLGDPVSDGRSGGVCCAVREGRRPSARLTGG